MTELLVSTKKGLFVLEGEPGSQFEIKSRAFAGEPVEYALRDPRSGSILAAVTSPFYGPKIFYAEDPSGEWEQADGVALPEGGDEALVRLWLLALGEHDGLLYAGGDPGVLFVSRDGGRSWQLNDALWQHRRAEDWQPGGGGLCLHSIATWPGRARQACRRRLGGRRVADRGWRRLLAQGQRGHRPPVPARSRA